jgi:hypothetical protein
VRDNGEATVMVVAIGGALITASPVILAVAGNSIESGLLRVGALAFAVTAIGILAGFLWRAVLAPLKEVLLGRAPDPESDDPGQPSLAAFIQDTLRHRDEDEKWKFAVQEQLRDQATRLDALNPHPREDTA